MPDLQGKRIVITRPLDQAEPFARAVRSEGGVPVLLPVIEIGPAPDLDRLDAALRRLEDFDWVVFTSVNGVSSVWQRLAILNIASLPSDLSVAAIGPKTAQALRENGIEPDYIPDEFVAEAILPGLGDLQGCRVLLPRADIARPALADLIRQAGGVAIEIAAYRTLPAEPDGAAIACLQEGVDVLTFTSSSTVRNFVALARTVGLDPLQLPGSPRVICIGPITAQTAQEEGFSVDRVADQYTIEGLLAVLLSRP